MKGTIISLTYFILLFISLCFQLPKAQEITEGRQISTYYMFHWIYSINYALNMAYEIESKDQEDRKCALDV